MDVAAGAMRPLLEKLGRLLVAEYSLEDRVKKGVKSLLAELEMMHAALRKVGDKPREELDDQVLIWADKVRELSYSMEDAVDTFMVRVEDDDGRERGPNNVKNRVKKFLKRTKKLFSRGKALHEISDAMDEARELAKELGDLRQRYMLDAQAKSTIDPRLKAVYRDVSELVGIEDGRDELIKMLTDGHEKQQVKTVSIVGFGGIGKTTLAKAVYDKIKGQFGRGAFVTVSRNPDIKRIFKKILHQLDRNKYAAIHEAVRDEGELIDELRMFLQDKRYLIVIDDIWDEEAWGIIKCAFSESGLGSTVITTTRNINVSKACSISGDDMIYQMKPLSEDDSKSLFYKRIFPQETGCPHELEQVSKNILKKCGGVPLAIITVASLLATSDEQIKPKYQWETLHNSIGRGLAEGGSVKDMQRILSFSYYDLPSHLKTCLLYLSIFPEDFEIMKDRLIWRWIAEGFVQGGKQETRLYELGESYFNELANRNLIQPVYDDHKVVACRVHDMVLDLICSMSSEENFVTILDGTQQSKHNLHSKVRRLSFQNSMSELTTHWVDVTSMSQLRSVTLFRTDVDLMQTALSCFQVLRVLDLEGCNFGKSGHKIDLKPIENLLHLRYLGLRVGGTCVGVLPVDIGKLKFLETLDLRSGSEEPLVVPSSVVQLRHLMCLHLYWKNTKIPTGMGNLASLEEVTGLWVDGSSAIEKELGQLQELRVLEIYVCVDDESVCSSLVASLGNLRKLQSLTIWNDGKSRFDVCWNSLVPPPYLSSIEFCYCTSTLPTWINSASLPLLSSLTLGVDRVCLEVDIQILGKLPALCDLKIFTTKAQCTRVERFIVGADAFPCLRECGFGYFQTGPSMFPRGAMPRLEILLFCARASHIASGELDVSMEHLPSLQRVRVILWREKAAGGTSDEFEEAKAALRLAADAHPNRPTLLIDHY
ncbi:hypothetical protein BRADI_2g39091v3, partial [Brachypodium distachyon]